MQIALRIGLLLIAISPFPQIEYLHAEPAPPATASTALKIDREHPQASLAAIATWLAEKYNLPRVNEVPIIEFVPASRLATIRFKGLLPDSWQSGDASTEVRRRIIAVYDDAQRTIYLPEGWTGATLAEQSILVHEMVHHLQNLGGLKFECAGAREKLAYEAQDDWLKAHGSDLEKELEIDVFTVFIAAACMN